MTQTNPKDPQADMRKEISDLFNVGLVAYNASNDRIMFSPDSLVDAIMDKFQAHQQELLSELLGKKRAVKTYGDANVYFDAVPVAAIQSKIGELNG